MNKSNLVRSIFVSIILLIVLSFAFLYYKNQSIVVDNIDQEFVDNGMRIFVSSKHNTVVVLPEYLYVYGLGIKPSYIYETDNTIEFGPTGLNTTEKILFANASNDSELLDRIREFNTFFTSCDLGPVHDIKRYGDLFETRRITLSGLGVYDGDAECGISTPYYIDYSDMYNKVAFYNYGGQDTIFFDENKKDTYARYHLFISGDIIYKLDEIKDFIHTNTK